MATSIETLVALSETDKDLLEARRKRARLEKELLDARKPLESCESSLVEKQSLYDAVAANHQNAQRQLTMDDDFIAKLEAQVPLIRTQKEFLAGKKQLEEARKHRGLTENALLENEINQEEYQNALKAQKEELEVIKADFEKRSKNLKSEKENSVKEVTRLEAAHKKNLAGLDAALLKFYKRSQERGLVSIITGVTNKACGGCNTVLQPQLMNEMMSHPEEHRNCPFCYRVIYYIPEPEAEVAEEK